jgi:hypothetical protein
MLNFKVKNEYDWGVLRPYATRKFFQLVASEASDLSFRALGLF